MWNEGCSRTALVFHVLSSLQSALWKRDASERSELSHARERVGESEGRSPSE